MTNPPWHTFYDPGVPTHLDYPAVPIQHFLEQSALDYPQRPCTIYQGAVITYHEMDEATSRIAGALVRLGVARGDRVGLLLPNSPHFVLAYFGILKAGGVVVATNPAYAPPEIQHQVNDAGIQVMFTADAFYEKFKSVQPQTGVRLVILSGAQAPAGGDICFDNLLSGGDSPLPQVGAQDVALFQYTGGTTGIAKGAVALHRNLVANTLQFKAWMVRLEPGRETSLLAIPLYHAYGMVCGLCLSMALGASMLLIPAPLALDDLLDVVQQFHPTYFPAVPTLYNAINSHPEVKKGKYNLSSIKACISGSAPLLKETKETFEALTGGRICEGYGLSEAPTATHCNPLLGTNKIGSIGLPLPDVDCRIVDVESGESDVPPGEVGELILRGPQVMKEYHNQPQETTGALRRGWLFTGDLARMDEHGYFYLVERKKELIKHDGMQVWPREVEEAIAAHPRVLEAAAAGVPDAYHGEAVKAWVVLKPGETMDESELQEWCRQRLASFKVPSQVEFRSKLPRSGVGKVLRRELVSQHLQRSGVEHP